MKIELNMVLVNVSFRLRSEATIRYKDGDSSSRIDRCGNRCGLLPVQIATDSVSLEALFEHSDRL